jgi:hypothetical protein
MLLIMSLDFHVTFEFLFETIFEKFNFGMFFHWCELNWMSITFFLHHLKIFWKELVKWAKLIYYDIKLVSAKN